MEKTAPAAPAVSASAEAAFDRYQELLVAVDRLHQAIGTPDETRAAHEYLLEVERVGWAVWRYRANSMFFARYEDIGAAMIAGRNREIAVLLAGILNVASGDDQLIATADPRTLGNSDWISVGWMRILAEEWTPLPNLPAAGRLPLADEDAGEIVAPLLDLVAAGDSEGALRLAAQLAERHEEGRSSVLVAGLRRVLPPPPPRELTDPALFFVYGDGHLKGRGLDPALAELALDAYPLCEVESLDRQEWADPSGASWSVVVESLACGHRRAAYRREWTEARSRRCARCPRREMEDNR